MILHNARLITWNQPNEILAGHALRIEQGRITAIAEERALLDAHPDEESLDVQGQVVMPGNICAHTHFYGAFARGMAIPGRAPDAFPAILEKLWWPLDRALRPEDVRYSALVCLVDAIKHGTTTLIDHHASPNAIDGSLDIIADAVDESGLRGVLCYEVTDRDGPERAQAGIRENVRFLERCASAQVAQGRVAAMFGLHAGLTLSEETLARCRDQAPEDAGFHIHVAEHEVDEYDSLARSGMRIVDRLAQHQMLGDRSIAVHAVHVDAGEIARLAESKTWVTHQPRSNMNNGVGLPETEAMLRMGVRVGLGNDGFSNAMWQEWKAAYLSHKLWHRDPRRMQGDVLVEMAIENNAALAQQFFPSAPIGVLAVGAQADLIFVDYHPTTPMTPGNLPWHIVFGFHESMITSTMVAGKLLMHQRELLTLDEAAITARSRELVEQVWARYQKNVPAGI